MPVHGDVLSDIQPAHRLLRYQVMKTDILVFTVLPISLVYDFPSLFLYYPDEVFGFDNWGICRKFMGRSIAIQALFYDRPDLVCFRFQPVVFKLFEQPATGHDVLVGILRKVFPDLDQIGRVIIQVDRLHLFQSSGHSRLYFSFQS